MAKIRNWFSNLTYGQQQLIAIPFQLLCGFILIGGALFWFYTKYPHLNPMNQ